MKRTLGITVGIALVLAVLFYGSTYLSGTKADLVADPGILTGTTGGDTMPADPAGIMADAAYVCACRCPYPDEKGTSMCLKKPRGTGCNTIKDFPVEPDTANCGDFAGQTCYGLDINGPEQYIKSRYKCDAPTVRVGDLRGQ